MYKWFLAWRYLHTKLIAFFGIAAVMFCVAMVLVVMSVMGGFLDTIRLRAKGLHSEVILESGSLQGFPFYEAFSEHLTKRLPNVVRQVTPVIYTYAIFRVPDTKYTKPARVLGIRLDEYVRVNSFGGGLHYDRYFPGTTTLGLQQLPVAGFKENGPIRLPADLEEANARWRQAETDPEAIERFDANPFEPAPYPYVTPAILGERVFSVAPGEAMYEGAERFGIIVGCDLLNDRRPDGNFDRHLARGAPIALTLQPLSAAGNPNEPPVKVALRYADDSRSGIFEIDSMNVYVDFDMLQHKLAMDPQERVGGGMTNARASQLLIGLYDGVDLDGASKMIGDVWIEFVASLEGDLSDADRRALGYADVYTWEDLQRPFIAAVEKERVLVTILFSLISTVAVVLVGCIFYMIVEKKTRDIGILKALGASSRGVMTLFVVYAGVVGVVGAVLGTCLGTVFVWNINDFQDFLASIDPQLRVWSPDVYSFDKIPEVVHRADVIWVGSIAVVASVVGSLIPAVIAGRVWPVQALRYE